MCSENSSRDVLGLLGFMKSITNEDDDNRFMYMHLENAEKNILQKSGFVVEELADAVNEYKVSW